MVNLHEYLINLDLDVNKLPRNDAIRIRIV